MSLFKSVLPAPADPIFGVAAGFNACKLAEKYLLSVGVYRTEEGKPFVFPAVAKAEDRIIHKHYKDYLPMTGYEPFVEAARKLLWGKTYSEIGDRVATIQSAAGTGALSLISEFSKKNLDFPTVLISDPAWPNYKQVFGDLGHKVSYYPWVKDCRLDMAGTLTALKNAPDGSLAVFQACAHNPSGVDPIDSQWDELFDMCDRKNHTIAFDFAYMGYASGDIDVDAEVVRRYAKCGRQFFVAFSFSKCMGLYGERIGACHAVCATPKEASAVKSKLASALRASISVAPQNGALIAAEVLNTPELRSQWISELKGVSSRVIQIRNKLCDTLDAKTSLSWDFLRNQRGMFALTGLNPSQVDLLAQKGVFIPQNGRISVPALNTKNVNFVSQAIADVVNSK